jgi:Na+-transporting methylmalonyl-CoA/oxaloacetate decarboxylase gamma subunit
MGASMLLGFPDWIVFTGMSMPFALTTLIAAMQTVSKFTPEEASA